MINLAQPMRMKEEDELPVYAMGATQMLPMKPSPLGIAVDLAENKAIDMALNRIGAEGAKKALATAGATVGGPIGAIGGEVMGEMLVPFIKQLFFARGGYAGPLALAPGGEVTDTVPKKYKGFSKLPEAVQQKIDPELAKRYQKGDFVMPSYKPLYESNPDFLGLENMGMSAMKVDEDDMLKKFMKTGKMPLGEGYSLKPDINKGGGSLTLEYEFSKDGNRNMMTGIKNMFNRFGGGR